MNKKGERGMLTPFGKELRIFRLQTGELLKDMAIKLNISPAYLSAVENGKKEPTNELMNRIQTAYQLDERQNQAFEDAKAKTLREVVIRLDEDENVDLGLKFARKLNTLSKDQRNQIMNLLNQADTKEVK